VAEAIWMKLPRLLLAVVVALAFLVGLPAPRAAASCAYPPDDPQLLSLADVIFTGQLVGNSTADLGASREYTFRVLQVYKGDAYQEQIAVTDNQGAEGLRIDGAGTFLVQAQYGDGATSGPVKRLAVNGCDGTRLLRDPAVLPPGLGAARAPTAGSSKTFTPQLTSNLWIGAGVALIALAIVFSSRRTRQRPPERS
jgi:hypothetical protein